MPATTPNSRHFPTQHKPTTIFHVKSVAPHTLPRSLHTAHYTSLQQDDVGSLQSAPSPRCTALEAAESPKQPQLCVTWSSAHACLVPPPALKFRGRNTSTTRTKCLRTNDQHQAQPCAYCVVITHAAPTLQLLATDYSCSSLALQLLRASQRIRTHTGRLPRSLKSTFHYQPPTPRLASYEKTKRRDI